MSNNTYKAKYSDYLIHGIYYLIYGFVKYIPSPIGDILRYWTTKPFIKKMGRVKIFEGVTIGYPYNVVIGDNVTLNNGVTIDGCGGVVIGDSCRIAHRATILSSDHITNKMMPIYEQGLVAKRTVINDDCWLGCNSVIMPGLLLESGTVVAANSVVTKKFEAFSIIGGVPARLLKYRI